MAGTNSFCSTCCLGEPWCSEWDCCDKENTEPQEKQPVSTENFEPLKKNNEGRPVTQEGTLCTTCVYGCNEAVRRTHSGGCVCFSSGGYSVLKS